MAKVFSTNIDLEQNELKNARVENLASAPSNPVVGQLYFNTTDSLLFCWNGVDWDGLESSLQATETVSGISERATQEEVHAGVDDLRHITPLKLESEKGIPNGIASLDETGKLDNSLLTGGAKSMVVSFASGTSTGLSTSTVGYVRKADFIYAGSSVVGPITAIKATIWKSDIGGASGSIKIINKSNADVICELINIDNTDSSVVLDLGPLSNVPTGTVTFEVQLSRSNGASRIIECSTLEIVY